MKVATPLWLKISLWLLLNLLLLAALGVGFITLQGGLGWSALVAGPTGDRAQTMANAIAGEVFAASPENRDAVLARFSATYGAQFSLYRFDQFVAGAATPLPAEVRAKLETLPPGRGPRGEGFGPPGGRGGENVEGFGPPPGWPRRGGRGEKGEKSSPPPPGAEPPRGDASRATPTAANVAATRPPPPDPVKERERGRFLLRMHDPDAYWLGLRVQSGSPGGRPPAPTMIVARIDSFGGVMRFLQLEPWLIGAGVALGLSILFWLPLIFGITRAIGQLTKATEQIAEGRFDTRVAADRRDEIGKLGDSVNRMAARLDAHMTGQKRFLGDVAHELCSPLARLQMASGILDEQAPPKLQPMVNDVRDEVQQMSALVNELLAFTKSGLAAREVELQPVEVAPLVGEALKREAAPEFVTATIPAGLRVKAEPMLLGRALGNLVRNALRYAGESGAVTVTAQRENDRVVIAVEDLGPGVPAGDLDRLGEPFFRPELARTRESGGVGLGLAIVRNSIAACGGEVRFANRSPRGFRAELRLAAA